MKLLVLCRANLFRDGLLLLLQTRLPACQVVLADGPGLPADEALPAGRLVAILFDCAYVDDAPDALVAGLVSRWPGVPLIGLCAAADDDVVETCLAAGAALCVRKDASAEVLLATLQTALSPSVFLRRVGEQGGEIRLVTTSRRSTDGLPWHAPVGITAASLGLTPKQSRVLGLLLEGKSAKSIARELGLCTGTVKTHTTAVLRALNVNTRVQAVLAARRLGLQPEACH